MRALVITLVFTTLAGCTGTESSSPPIVGIRNMYNQPRYDTQERQPFFADQRSMRPEVEGTVSREMTKGYHSETGLSASTKEYVSEVPPDVLVAFPSKQAFVARGQDRYNVFCAPCHSMTGDGKGMVSRRAAARADAPIHGALAGARACPSAQSDRLAPS